MFCLVQEYWTNRTNIYQIKPHIWWCIDRVMHAQGTTNRIQNKYHSVTSVTNRHRGERYNTKARLLWQCRTCGLGTAPPSPHICPRRLSYYFYHVFFESTDRQKTAWPGPVQSRHWNKGGCSVETASLMNIPWVSLVFSVVEWDTGRRLTSDHLTPLWSPNPLHNPARPQRRYCLVKRSGACRGAGDVPWDSSQWSHLPASVSEGCGGPWTPERGGRVGRSGSPRVGCSWGRYGCGAPCCTGACRWCRARGSWPVWKSVGCGGFGRSRTGCLEPGQSSFFRH